MRSAHENKAKELHQFINPRFTASLTFAKQESVWRCLENGADNNPT